ncbi:hypothetical protein LJR235_002949 [Pararhizobium sp. LjRoot235]|uniref:hypothetical protein n=1 Tax=Pararhizobium sp. LjRoot235 TaxID=3342291 RepID=UPI003ECEAF0B
MKYLFGAAILFFLLTFFDFAARRVLVLRKLNKVVVTAIMAFVVFYLVGKYF